MISRCFAYLTWIFVVLGFASSGAQMGGDVRVGVAAVEIRPQLGAPMAAYYSARGCSGVHDPPHASAMVIERFGVRAALVALDVISTTKELVELGMAIKEKAR